MSTIVDCHMHVLGGTDWFPADLSRGAVLHWHREVRWRGEKTTPEYFFAAGAEAADPDGSKAIARMNEAGIDISCTMPMDQGYRIGDVDVISIEQMNQRSCEIAANSDGRIITFCGVDPRRKTARQLLIKALDEWGAKGLKLYPTNGFYPDDAELCYPLYDVIAERGMPVLLHQGHSGRSQKSKYGHPMYVDTVAADYPDMPIVLGHSGRWEAWSNEAFAIAIYKTNVYLDMSLWQHWASPDEICKKVLWLRDRVGVDRVMFGSDMAGIEVSWTLKQWVDQIKMFPELAKQHGSSLSEHELAMLLGENAMRVYRLQPPRRNTEVAQPLTAAATA
jgi:predicted TIM-barrel fold metal-dependent hydrolase